MGPDGGGEAQVGTDFENCQDVSVCFADQLVDEGENTSLSTNQSGKPDVALGLEGGDGVVGHLLRLNDPRMVIGDCLG